MSTCYYLIDLNKPQSAGFLTSAAAVHKAGSNQAGLSVSKNVAGTQAIVKVNGDQSMLQKPDPQNVIIAEYTVANHSQIFDFFYTSEWQPAE